MSWYDEDFAKRAAISVHCPSASSSADVDVVIPPDWDDFWETIDSSGAELRVCDADGYTLLSYSVDNGSGGSFSKTSRLGRLRLDSVTLRNAIGVGLLWLYYDNTGASSAAVSTTISGALVGYIEQGRAPSDAIPFRPLEPGVSQPRVQRAKTPNETIGVWIDVTRALEHRRTATAGSDRWEEPWHVTPSSVDEEGTTAAVEDLSKTRWFETTSGTGRRMMLRLSCDAGSNGTNYTLKAPFYTRVPESTEFRRVLEPAVGILVRTPLEPAS